MAIYIKGVDMPKSAGDCSIKVNPDERECIFTHKVFEETFSLLTERRCDNCPLIEVKEPHGRLIDADTVNIPDARYHIFENCSRCTLLDKEDVREIIDGTPTVIEGSE